MQNRAKLLLVVLPFLGAAACVFSNDNGIDDPATRIDPTDITTNGGSATNGGNQGGGTPSSSSGTTSVGVTTGVTGSSGPTTGAVNTSTSSTTSGSVTTTSTTGSGGGPTTGSDVTTGVTTGGVTTSTSGGDPDAGVIGGNTGTATTGLGRDGGRVTTGGLTTGGTRGGTTGARSTTGATTTSSTTGSTGATTGTSTSDPLNAAAKCTSGKTWSSGNGLTMRPGENCVNCHSNFRIAGTVFPSGHEPNDCNGANGTSPTINVIITDSAGADHTITVNNVGNFETSTTISTPYKARVTANGKTRSMTATQTVGACNSCHTATGLNGAPGRITVPF